jgi:lysophospholipase L1-like esterase
MDIPTPYVDSEYESFKQDVNAAVDRHSTIALFLNIENIVAEPFWGDLPASDLSGIRQPDFMHFKAQGHQLTADALEPFIRDLNRP